MFDTIQYLTAADQEPSVVILSLGCVTPFYVLTDFMISVTVLEENRMRVRTDRLMSMI